jgi:hypothetical protein
LIAKREMHQVTYKGKSTRITEDFTTEILPGEHGMMYHSLERK